MKKIKILGILILIIFLNGCSATYSLNISDSTINESLSLKMNNSEFATFMENNNNKYVNMYFDDSNNIASEGVTLPLEGVKYYDCSIDDTLEEVTFSGQFKYNDFSRSSILKTGFNDVEFIVRNNEMHISTSEGFSFLNENLNSVKIIISSDFEVMYSNADKIESNNLIWFIDKTNYSTKKIKIDYKLVKSSLTENIDDKDEDQKDDNVPGEKENAEKNIKSSVIMVIIGFISFILVLFGILIITKRNK